MILRQFDIWLANLDPAIGSEPGKTRPVVVVQTDLLNQGHPSTLVCPLTSRISKNPQLLRIRINKAQWGTVSEILCDQIRAIDNKRFIRKLGVLHKKQIHELRYSLRVLLDLDE